MKKSISIILLCIGISLSANAQLASISTNALDWAWYGTANIKADIALARHISLGAGAKYNPWSFQNTDPDYPVFARQSSVSAGISFWPWVVFSGFHANLYGQYMQYSETGVFSQAIEESKQAGAFVSFGYCVMISRHLNLDLSIGTFGGYFLDHRKFCCANHMLPLETDQKMVIRPEDLCISLCFVF